MNALDATPVVANDLLPTDAVYSAGGQMFMSRLTLGRMRTTLEAPEGTTPVLRLSFREWRRWKLGR